ncbi:MAG: PhzF family phenazine biosynthesis protein [Zetaproteobacteria bacterium]|nr:PhzF family phenazine biosynthesis protein [Zetaproteobacteria bacterium]
MTLPIYHIDAFADQPFTGNPAAVCPLDTWLPDDVMQAIAGENNLSETAFFIPTQQGFHIRWFTPVTEVDLCGHATLAAAYVLFHCLNIIQDVIVFESKSGILKVSKVGDWLVMDFPAQVPSPCPIPDAIEQAFGIKTIACLKSEDYIIVFEHEADILAACPSLAALKKLDLRGVIITSTSDNYDFVSRFFAPNIGIGEDPVTGSAHTQLAPYWSGKLGKPKLRAKQLSARGGELMCEVVGQRVLISGKAVKYMQGEIVLPF